MVSCSIYLSLKGTIGRFPREWRNFAWFFIRWLFRGVPECLGFDTIRSFDFHKLKSLAWSASVYRGASVSVFLFRPFVLSWFCQIVIVCTRLYEMYNWNIVSSVCLEVWTWLRLRLGLCAFVCAGSISSVYHCKPCGKHFSSRARWREHGKFHEGKTRCPICGAVYSTVNNLRQHLKFLHDLDHRQVRSLVPLRATKCWSLAI